MNHDQALPPTPPLLVSSASPEPTPNDQPTVPPHEDTPIVDPSSGESNVTVPPSHEPPAAETPSTERQLLVGAEVLPHPRSQDNPYDDFDRMPLPPPAERSRDSHVRRSRRHPTMRSTSCLPSANRTSGLDWIVPVEEKTDSERSTIRQRIKETIDDAVTQRNKYAQKALWTGYALNIAIGTQVFLGAMTTGLAAAVTSARQAQISTAVLGGLSTLVASYLARARGSGEPELSITRVKDLEQFLRECKAFEMDHGHEYATPESGLDDRVDDLRRRFEELLGNVNGGKKVSPMGITPSQSQTGQEDKSPPQNR